MRVGVLSIGVAFLLFGALIMILDLHRLLSTAMIVWGTYLILRSVKEQEPDDERSKKLRDRALANSWILTTVLILVILILLETMGFKIEVALLLFSLLLMLSTAAIFRVYYEKRGDVEL
mgnify:CR=1 FL=1